jgi:RNA polymerase sigma-70 factor (ECF subfamily)
LAVDLKNRFREALGGTPGADDDVLLARDLIAGRGEAALVAWRRFHPMVETTLRRMLGPGGDLQDLAQEVFLRFFGKVRELKKMESLRSFVMAIAIRRAQEEIKRRRVRRWFAPVIGEVYRGPAVTQMEPETRETIAHFYRAIDRLNAVDRTIYVLRYIEDLELTEIAATLAVSISTVRRRLERVSRRMNTLISGDPVLAEYVNARRSARLERDSR